MKKNVTLIVAMVVLFSVSFVKVQAANDTDNIQQNFPSTQDGGGGSVSPDLKIEAPVLVDAPADSGDIEKNDSSENLQVLNAPVSEKVSNVSMNNLNVKTLQKSNIFLWIVSIISLVLNVIVITLILKLLKNRQ